ncbi:MAG: cation-translocating P-type ATPase [Bacteroidetes bacterium]|nr:cation-translocating P-type ATPase [Bacteroidota bacterium]
MHNHNEPIILKVEGMDCANCALGITRKLTKNGHEDVHVDFATGEASFVIAENHDINDVIHDIESLGYKVIGDEKKTGFSFGIAEKFWFSLIFTVPLFFGHMFFPHDSWIAQPTTQLLLCIPVFAIGFWFFGKSALGSLKSGVPNMDVLIFIGAVSSFGYSVAGMIMVKDVHLVHQYMFFETTATIISLVLLGNLLEHISVKKTTSAINELSSLQPEVARRLIMKDGKETFEEIPSSQLQKGDMLLVNGGESFPADGEVINGSGTANESMITGESAPVEKLLHSAVTGGTKISAIFVPVVLTISLSTFLIAHFGFHHSMKDALMNSIAVLVISCPCAMGLATPTAVMVGIGRAAKNGILIRGGRTLEQIAEIKTVVFDKTGTITTGNFSNIQIQSFSDLDANKIKEILLALESHSSHPLAKSIVGLLQKENIIASSEIEKITEEQGIGLNAIDTANNNWSLGSWRTLKNNQATGHDIYLMKNGGLIAGITLEDEIRSGMKELISFLHSKNIHTILLSGDRKEKCETVAKSIGIQEVYSEQLPAQKLELISRLSKENKTAMDGDGINDAPALARADVGISPGEATKSAMQSAQVILLGHGDLSRIRETFLIGKHSLRTIKQNLFWAFFYNAIAIPIAAFGLLSPIVAALSMAFSDVIVIGNSIRLRSKKLS